MDPVSIFPKDVSLIIFSNLDFQDLGRCCQVSKKWSSVAEENNLWKQFIKDIPLPAKGNIKTFIMKHSVKSLDKVLDHIKVFLDKASKDQICRFTCFFPLNPKSCIKVGIGYGNVDPEKRNQPDVEDFLVFTKRISEWNEMSALDLDIQKLNEGILRHNPTFELFLAKNPAAFTERQVFLPRNKDINIAQIYGRIEIMQKFRLVEMSNQWRFPKSSLYIIAAVIVAISAVALVNAFL